LIPQSPFLNINRSKKIAVIKKESLKKIKKYHNYRKMKFIWIIGLIIKNKLKKSKLLQKILHNKKN
ncbi:MAG: hypothetical protein ACTSRP_25735, partial [Candidatus Helarchaeota archaeon]